jgi:hypothetical protein
MTPSNGIDRSAFQPGCLRLGSLSLVQLMVVQSPGAGVWR